MKTSLDLIIEFADQAHGEQMRKYTPERYIVHPVRVMEMCKRFTTDPAILAAAILHDVLEDTPVRKSELLQFLQTLMPLSEAQRTLALVVDLTDVYVKKDYPRLNRKTRKRKELARLEQTSPDSQTIKYADIIDNTAEIEQQDKDFAKVFLKECLAMLKKLDKGNPVLYAEALHKVSEGLARLANAPERPLDS